MAPDFSRVQLGGTGMVIPGDYRGVNRAEVVCGTEQAAHAFARLAGLTPPSPARESRLRPRPVKRGPPGPP